MNRAALRHVRRELRRRRAEYLTSKPRCWCGRVGVEAFSLGWLCREHREPPEEAFEDCMCHFPRECGGLGVVECDGCGGDCCVCICGGGPVDCPGCELCEERDDDYLADEDDYPF